MPLRSESVSTRSQLAVMLIVDIAQTITPKSTRYVRVVSAKCTNADLVARLGASRLGFRLCTT